MILYLTVENGYYTVFLFLMYTWRFLWTIRFFFFLQFIDFTKVGNTFCENKVSKKNILINYFLKISKISDLTHRSYFEYLRFWQSQNIKFFLKNHIVIRIQVFWYNILHLKTDITKIIIIFDVTWLFLCSIRFFFSPPPIYWFYKSGGKKKRSKLFSE